MEVKATAMRRHPRRKAPKAPKHFGWGPSEGTTHNLKVAGKTPGCYFCMLPNLEGDGKRGKSARVVITGQHFKTRVYGFQHSKFSTFWARSRMDIRCRVEESGDSAFRRAYLSYMEDNSLLPRIKSSSHLVLASMSADHLCWAGNP